MRGACSGSDDTLMNNRIRFAEYIKRRQIDYRAADKRAALFLGLRGRCRLSQIPVLGERTRRLIFRHEKTPVLAYRSFFTQILKKGDV